MTQKEQARLQVLNSLLAEHMTLDELYILASQELDRDKRVEYYRRAQDIAAENLPVIYTTLSERLSAVRNLFGNVGPTLYGHWDIRYLYRTDQ